ncbi:AAA family ATPase [Martelella mediterranea]|uniref:Putative ATPase n=1 Tax=Martelella mediterranea TaxID=293089 RepID=A0A4R3NVT2_9HYPH|nr:AAA family ATPase [Martelella mediterranea]TCT41034.1 putative ATPase [Martelella mediterranea]
MENFIVISGCSGGGKSTLLEELSARGFNTVEEPGRRIVREEQQTGGSVLPWLDLEGFLRRAISVARQDCDRFHGCREPVFFDRGLVDAVAGLEHITGEAHADGLNLGRCYNRLVFMAPPWPEIYEHDAQRKHGFDEAKAEYERLMMFYPRLGYQPVLLPKTGIATRADFVLERLGAGR